MEKQKLFKVAKQRAMFICVCTSKALEFSPEGAAPVTPESSMQCAIHNIVEPVFDNSDKSFHTTKFDEAALSAAYTEPFVGERVGISLVGYIENNRYLCEALLGITNRVVSDGELVARLYRQYQSHQRKYVFLTYLGGKFAFVLYDEDGDIAFAARDVSGEHPLYQGVDPKSGGLLISNCNLKEDHKMQEILPGHFVFGKSRNRKLHPIGRPTSDAQIPVPPTPQRTGLRRSSSWSNLADTSKAQPQTSKGSEASWLEETRTSAKKGLRPSSSWSNLTNAFKAPSSSLFTKSTPEGSSRDKTSPSTGVRSSSSWNNLTSSSKPASPYSKGQAEKAGPWRRRERQTSETVPVETFGLSRRSSSFNDLSSLAHNLPNLEHSNTPSRRFRLTTTASATGTADMTDSWRPISRNDKGLIDPGSFEKLTSTNADMSQSGMKRNFSYGQVGTKNQG